MKLNISLIIPTLNEEENIEKIFHNIKLLQAKEILIIDGGSKDKTKTILKKLRVLKTRASRGKQLATGARISSQPWLFFLHADTKITISNVNELKSFIKKKENKVAYFRLKFDSDSFFAKIIALWANLRTKFFYLPFGDQCLLIKRSYYNNIGGFSNITKMEDMELILKIPSQKKYFFKSYVETSFKKYLKNGIIKQSFNNIKNQIFFFIK